MRFAIFFQQSISFNKSSAHYAQACPPKNKKRLQSQPLLFRHLKNRQNYSAAASSVAASAFSAAASSACFAASAAANSAFF